MDGTIRALRLQFDWRARTVYPHRDKLMVKGKTMQRYFTENGVVPIYNDLGTVLILSLLHSVPFGNLKHLLRIYLDSGIDKNI